MEPTRASAAWTIGLMMVPLTALRAQQGGTPPTPTTSTQPTTQDVQQRLDRLEQQHQEEIEDLREELDRLEQEVAAASARAQAPAQQSPSVFNPAITVFGNFLGRLDDRPVYVDDDPAQARIDDTFRLREAEIDLRSAIDPWADGVLIASFESETPGDFDAGIEEGYVLLKKLPVLDSAPGGLKIKAGRFRPAFGRFNSIHLHDLPQVTYPRTVQTFLGPEGFAADGLSGQFFLPSPSDRDVFDATLEVFDGGEIAVSPDPDATNVNALGHVKWFRDLAPGHDVEVGASLWSSLAENELYGLDATYRWKPFEAGEWKSFLLGAEIFASSLDDGVHDDHPDGWDVWSQYQLSKNLYVGARYGQADDLDDQSLVTQTVGAFVTYYTTEFLRFRVGVEHSESDVPELDELDTAYLELNFVYGSHPVEPYWVNR